MSCIFSQCMDCKNFNFDNPDKSKFTCKAFSDGIPDDVFWNKISHEDHIDNDNGFKFDPIYNN